MLRLCLCAAVAVLVSALPSLAQQPVSERLLDRSLTLSPQAPTVPELQYRLFPLASERKDGNAAPIYLRFAHERNDQVKKDLHEKSEKWLTCPLDQLPGDEVKRFLDGHAYNLKQLELGARRKTCDWNYTLDVDNLFGILLPDCQEMRTYARLLAIKARHEIATGNFAEAVRTLETGYAFAHHIAEGPFLINGLVGIACANEMSSCLLELIDRPGAPNLYWAITALPRPLIELRRPMEFEQRVLELHLPEVADLDRPRTEEEWQVLLAQLRKVVQKMAAMLDGKPPAEPQPEADQFEAGRKYLVETLGLKRKDVESMPKARVLVLYQVNQFRQYRDEWYKAAYLNYAEARPVLERADKRLKDAPNTEAVVLTRALLPAIKKCQFAQARLERVLAAARVVEAIRLHAAANKGQLPEKLSDVTAVPVPLDPATGKAFEYKRDGDSATLSSRVPDEPSEPNGLKYRLTMRK